MISKIITVVSLTISALIGIFVLYIIIGLTASHYLNKHYCCKEIRNINPSNVAGTQAEVGEFDNGRWVAVEYRSLEWISHPGADCCIVKFSDGRIFISHYHFCGFSLADGPGEYIREGVVRIKDEADLWRRFRKAEFTPL